MENHKYPEISKSPKDPNRYRYFSLTNGIKSFLISNPQATASHPSFEDPLEKKPKKSTFQQLKDYSKLTQNEAKTKHKIDKKSLISSENDEIQENEENSELIEENQKLTTEEITENVENNTNQGISSVVVLIETGSANEPKSFHGLAHLLEHVIFLGSKEYPEQDSFSQFISINGGSDNGRTSLDYTFFDFSVENEHLNEALYRFARLLKEPLFPEDGIVKELKAVNNEFELSQSSDGSRNFQILLSNSCNESKYNSFSWGSTESLSGDVKILREEIIKYWKKFYINEKIKICVYSKLDLDVVEGYIHYAFDDLLNGTSEIPSKALENHEIITTSKNDDFHRTFYSGMYYVETIKNEHLLIISFPLKPFFHHHRSKSISPLVNLINEEGPNSLYHFLKKSNLINSLYAYTDDDDGINSLFFLFTIELDLTEKGIENWLEILKEFFVYLEMIKKNPEIPNFYLNQLKILAEMGFLYGEDENPACMVEKLAFLMTYVEPKELILVYNGLYLEWNQGYYMEILDQLTKKNSRITLMTKNECFPKRISLDLKEKWFKTKYYKEDIGEWVLKYIEEDQMIHDRYKFPIENPYFPNKLEVLQIPESVNNEIPKIVFSNMKGINEPRVKLWHCFDIKELKPKICIELVILYRSMTEDIEDQINMEFFIDYFFEKFNESIGFQSSEAEICFEASFFEGKGINFSVYGYFDKIPIFLEKAFNLFIKVCQEPIDSDMFSQIKSRIIKDFKNYVLDSENQLQESINNLIFPDYYLPEQYEPYLERYTISMFSEFCQKNLQSYENFFSVTGYIHGNIYEEAAILLFNKVFDSLKAGLNKKRNIYSKALITKEFLCKKILKLPGKTLKNEYFISEAKNETNKNYLVVRYIDFGRYDIIERNKLSVLLSILSPQTHEFLRMQRQIGYMANASLSDVRNRLGVCIIVNSSERNIEEISKEIEEFIDYFIITVNYIRKFKSFLLNI